MNRFFYFVIFTLIAFAQENYEFKGRIVDAETGEALVGVNVYRENSIEGTASDLDGNFTFFSSQQKPIVKVSYVGYLTQTIQIKHKMTIRLKEDVITSSIVVVTAKGLSKAQQIVVNSIENYQDRLKNVSAMERRVYSKAFFQRKKNKRDSVIDDSLRNIGEEIRKGKYEPWVFEAYKQINWENPDRLNQVILKRNQGKAFPAMFNVLGVIYYQNAFNEHFMEEASPMHLDYFDGFNYSYKGKKLHQEDSVHVIFANRTDTTSYWNYKMLIDEDFNLKRIEVAQKQKAPKRSVRISPFMRIGNAKNVTVMQDYEESSLITVPKNYFITRITNRGVIRFSELYQSLKLNDAVESARFSKQEFQIKPDVDDFTKEDWLNIRPEALNPVEERAYTASDSLYQSQSAWDRFMFDYGFKIALFDYRLGNYKLTSSNDIYHFNKVEGHYLGLGIRNFSTDEITWSLAAGYATGIKKFYGRGQIEFPISYAWDLSSRISVYRDVRSINSLSANFPTINTFNALFGHKDDYNYLERSGYNISLFRQASNDLSYGIVYRHQDYIGLDNHSDFSIFKPSSHYTKNLHVEDSKEHELAFQVNYEELYNFDLGSFKLRFPKENAWQIKAELSFNANDANKLQFKRASLNLFKVQRLKKGFFLELNSDIYYLGKAEKITRMFFPRVPQFLEPKIAFSLSGFERYKTGSFDFASLGASFRFDDAFEGIGLNALGDFYLHANAFTMNNYGISQLADVEIKHTKLDFVYGLSLRNELFFFPLRFSLMHNTRIKDTSFLITFGQSLNFQ